MVFAVRELTCVGSGCKLVGRSVSRSEFLGQVRVSRSDQGRELLGITLMVADRYGLASVVPLGTCNQRV